MAGHLVTTKLEPVSVLNAFKRALATGRPSPVLDEAGEVVAWVSVPEGEDPRCTRMTNEIAAERALCLAREWLRENVLGNDYTGGDEDDTYGIDDEVPELAKLLMLYARSPDGR